MGFSRQEYWSGLPFSSPVIFSIQGLNSCLLPRQALAGTFFTAEPQGKPTHAFFHYVIYIVYTLAFIFTFKKLKLYLYTYVIFLLIILISSDLASFKWGLMISLYAEYIMRNAGLEEAQAGIKIATRNINNLRYADGTTLTAESEEELKSLLMKVKEESEKVGLKLNIQKMKIMAFGPITSWEIDGETVETVSDFIFWGSKITANGDCSREVKRCLLLGRKVMTNLDSIFRGRDITLLTKVRLVKAMVFPVVRYGCEGWTVKTAECRRIDAFELWCWRRLLRVPWTARRSN